MLDYLAILALVAICLLLVIDRYFDKEQHIKQITSLLEELARTNKALISKNAHEYVMTTSIDKVQPELPKKEEDPTQDVSQLSDTEFDKFIEKQNGK